MALAQRMTAEEFLGRETETRWEQLIEGEIVLSQPAPLHQLTVKRVLLALEGWASAAAGRGTPWLPLDVVLDDFNVYAPDVLWYADGTGPTRDTRPPSPVPALAVEVRSPSTWHYDVGIKKDVYEREGLGELWLVDTAASKVLVFRRSTPGAPSFDVAVEAGASEALTSPRLPGFALDLDELFAAF